MNDTEKSLKLPAKVERYAISTQDTELIEELSQAFFTYQDIAVYMEIPFAEFRKLMRDNDSEAYKAYHRGKLNSQLAIRKQIIDMAKLGSPAAQTEAIKLLKEMNIEEDE